MGEPYTEVLRKKLELFPQHRKVVGVYFGYFQHFFPHRNCIRGDPFLVGTKSQLFPKHFGVWLP